jgi:hypothetical protein
MHPLSLLWLLCAVALIGGIIEWFFLDRSPWEGFGAALALAGVTKIVAHVKGIPAWPWEKGNVDATRR